jgi:hypothetical protein
MENRPGPFGPYEEPGRSQVGALECCAAVILQEAADGYKRRKCARIQELEQDDQSEVLQITANILEGIEAAPKTEKIAQQKETSSAKMCIKAKKVATKTKKKKSANTKEV